MMYMLNYVMIGRCTFFSSAFDFTPTFLSPRPAWHFMVVATLLSIFSLLSPVMAAHRERTFIMIKPDGVQRGIIGEIVERFEKKGFKLISMKFMQASESLLQEHYAELAGRPFFNGLIKYMQSGPVVPMVWEGLNIVQTARQMIGETNPMESKPGTIRGDLCVLVGRNIIHGSDSIPSAEREIGLWFKDNELVSWQQTLENWIYE